MTPQGDVPRGSAEESIEAVAMKPLCYPILLAVIMVGCAKSKAVVGPPSPAPPKPHAEEEKPASTAPKLLPQVGGEKEDQMKHEAEAKIEGTEQLFSRIDQETLGQDQQEIFSTIRVFLSKAKEALSIKDFLRAFNLADKAQVLAEELAHIMR